MAHADDLPRGANNHPTWRATPPTDWARFCKATPAECSTPDDTTSKIKLTDETKAVLERVAKRVNGELKYEDDQAHWGVEDRYDLPTDGRGDCEDSAIWKRRLLINAGFPARALLLTIVTFNGRGHAFLTVVTDRGDMVLDNLSWRLTPMDQLTEYKFIQRQDPNQLDQWRRWDRGY